LQQALLTSGKLIQDPNHKNRAREKLVKELKEFDGIALVPESVFK